MLISLKHFNNYFLLFDKCKTSIFLTFSIISLFVLVWTYLQIDTDLTQILKQYFRQRLGSQSKNQKLDLSPEIQKSMKYCNSFQLLCTCKNPALLTVKACRLGIGQEEYFYLSIPTQ